MNKEKLKEIYTKYNLDKEDIFVLKFGGKDKPIITRAGIEKIKNQLSAQVNYKIEKLSDDNKYCVVLSTGVLFEGKIKDVQPRPKLMVQSFGEVSPENNKSNYPICMAEKRAMGRVILKLANLTGIYSEDESEDFIECCYPAKK